MPKASRLFVDYACYHVMARGNRKQDIFMDAEDFTRYLNILRRAFRRYELRLYAYCLMPNHVHLLVEPIRGRDLSRCMHWLNRGYTAYYNFKYSTVGHLWQGRFRSKPIVKGQYLIHCANYIEGNPVRAKMVEDIAEYRWSSYKERCLLSKNCILAEMTIDQSIYNEGALLISEKGAL